MSTRNATIIENDESQEIISNVAQVEGGAPEVSFGRDQKFADGVLIGMIKGGPVDAVGDFGFPEGTKDTGERAVGVAKADQKDAKPTKAKAKNKPAADDPPIDPPADPDKSEA